MFAAVAQRANQVKQLQNMLSTHFMEILIIAFNMKIARIWLRGKKNQIIPCLCNLHTSSSSLFFLFVPSSNRSLWQTWRLMLADSPCRVFAVLGRPVSWCSARVAALLSAFGLHFGPCLFLECPVRRWRLKGLKSAALVGFSKFFWFSR